MPDPAYSLFPFPRGFEGIMGASGMAFCINQPVGALEKPGCRLHKQEMLPDVSGISGMHPVIISAHQSGHLSFLLDLFSDERPWPEKDLTGLCYDFSCPGFQMDSNDPAGG